MLINFYFTIYNLRKFQLEHVQDYEKLTILYQDILFIFILFRYEIYCIEHFKNDPYTQFMDDTEGFQTNLDFLFISKNISLS